MKVKGFTTLELLIVIVLFVGFTAIALPRYQAYERTRMSAFQPVIKHNCVAWMDVFFISHYHCWKTSEEPSNGR